MIPNRQVLANESDSFEKCVIFSAGDDNSVNINSNSFCINGDIVTNGTVSLNSMYMNKNGSIMENQDNYMLDLGRQIDKKYFTSNTDYITDDYDILSGNENINITKYIEGCYNCQTNMSINRSALIVASSMNVNCDSMNTNNSVMYSMYGDICIEANNVSINGLVYAPMGNIHITGANVNVTGSLVAQSIEINGQYNINLNCDRTIINALSEIDLPQIRLYEDDPDIIDIGQAYVKEISSEEEIIYAGEGIYCVNNQMLVSADPEISYEYVENIIAGYNARIVGYIELTNDYQIEFISDTSIDEIKKAIEIISLADGINHVSLNYVTDQKNEFVSNDSEYKWNWDETNPGGHDAAIEALKLESALVNAGVITSRTSSYTDVDTSMLYDIKLGIMDSAFDTWHEDIDFVKCWSNYDSRDEVIKVNDFHGTRTSGLMSASFNNGKGITGISVKNRLYGYAVNSRKDPNLLGKQTLFSNKYGLSLLVGNNCRIINRSLGACEDFTFGAMHGNANALNRMQTEAYELELFLIKLIDMGYEFLLVNAAGNANTTSFYKDDNPVEAPYGFVVRTEYLDNLSKYPYADTSVTYGMENSGADIIDKDSLGNILPYDSEYADPFFYISNPNVRSRIIVVGAIDGFNSSKMALFSNKGERIDISAPGVNVRMCSLNDEYVNSQGTSYASPLVSGALGMALSVNPSLSARELGTLLKIHYSDCGFDNGFRVKEVNVNELVIYAKKCASTYERGSKLNTSKNIHDGLIMGTVVTKDGKPIADAAISVEKIDDYGMLVDNTDLVSKISVTDSEGTYVMSVPDGKYRLLISKSEYQAENVYVEILPETTTYVDTVILQKTTFFDGLNHKVFGHIADAETGASVSGARVKLRKGWNNIYGNKVEIEGVTNDSGDFLLYLPSGIYTAEINKDGYVTGYANMISSAADDDIQYAVLSPYFDENEYRVVLTWGETPSDLDSHLYGSVDGHEFEIYYSNSKYYKDGEIIASLDFDDTTSYGPETITFSINAITDEVTYKVHDYSNGWSTDSYELSFSSAKVTVYQGNRILRTMNVPVKYKGTWWNVFSISNNKLNIINTITE